MLIMLLQQIQRRHLALFLGVVLITALIYSPFLLSVSMIGFAVLFTFSWFWDKPGCLRFNPHFFDYFRIFFSSKVHLAITLSFFLVLLSGFLTEDYGYWMERLRLKIPFLVLPIIFCGLPVLSRREYFGLLYFLVFALVVTCLGIGINYVLHFEHINLLMKQGQPMPTPRNHIRFSLVLALGIVAGLYIWRSGYYLKYKWEQQVLIGSVGFLFFFIHLLSVRSGLATLYMAILVLIIRYVYLTGRYGVALLTTALLVTIPIMAYFTIPSFQSKVAYMRHEIWVQKNDQPDGEYSDAGRLASLKIGMEIGNESPLFGIGAGNLRQEVRNRYAVRYPKVSEPKMPHNQFVSVYAGMGITGLLLFVFAFFYPLVYQKNYRDPLFLAFHVIVLCSFMAENTIENSIGVAFYLFFLLLGLNYLKGSGFKLQT
ncbi:MAG: hypothetical protein DHS20C18_31770 [Saprospiraceae bacterium]|nr:MAG: hypothetical protein DHS20C18_31770 [Saprospiraceae bacterium]